MIVVDGIRVENRAISNSTGTGVGGQVPSRLNDIDPEDIEAIEVQKGPAPSPRNWASLRPTMQPAVFLLVVQIALPPPRGYVNDFAGVLDAASVSHLDAVIAEVRAKSRGEIAVVTLPDIGDRAASDVALQIGRQWGVGAKGEAGDPAKNLGVVVLLVPQKNHRPGTGKVFITTGRGAEGFLPDARVGRIRDAMLPYLAREDYGAGLVVGVDLIAQAFAREVGFTLTGARPPPSEQSDRLPIPAGLLIGVAVLLIILTRGRILWWFLWFSSLGGGGRRRGWDGGGGGGFSGGFGGFGGGGGFSGGGAGGSF